MKRSSGAQFAQRVNGALKLLSKRFSVSSIVSVLIKRYGISFRQAYRYLRCAEETKRALPIPESKIVFTVKLPINLTRRLRQRVKSSGESLSGIVTQACEEFLKRHG